MAVVAHAEQDQVKGGRRAVERLPEDLRQSLGILRGGSFGRGRVVGIGINLRAGIGTMVQQRSLGLAVIGAVIRRQAQSVRRPERRPTCPNPPAPADVCASRS